MKHSVKKLSRGKLEITCELLPDELEVYLEAAASRISEKQPVPGFRPGRASRAEIEKRVGGAGIIEEALPDIARKSYAEAVRLEELDVVGSPAVDVKKLAPGNPLVLVFTVSVLPKVIGLADYKQFKAKRAPKPITEEAVLRVLYDLQRSQTRETRVRRPIEGTDRVVLDLNILKNNVPIEGGATKDHVVFMDEKYYVPGFTDALLGLSEGDEKKFTLNFPAEHYKKDLAGAPVDFHVKICEVNARDFPALDDAFAKTLGQNSMADLRALISRNLEKESEVREEERLEKELLERLASESRFEDIPDVLVNEEASRMVRELEQAVTRDGLLWKDYLARIKKTEPELKLEFAPQAVLRIKITLAVREVAKKEEIFVTEEELNAELDRQAEYYKDDQETRSRIYAPEYRDQLKWVMQNKKTVDRVKALVFENGK